VLLPSKRLVRFIHRSAWKGYSAKFAGTAFSEVRVRDAALHQPRLPMTLFKNSYAVFKLCGTCYKNSSLIHRCLLKVLGVGGGKGPKRKKGLALRKLPLARKGGENVANQ